MSSYLTLLFILICCCYLTDCTPKQSCHSERIQKQVGLVVYNSVLSFCRSLCISIFAQFLPHPALSLSHCLSVALSSVYQRERHCLAQKHSLSERNSDGEGDDRLVSRSMYGLDTWATSRPPMVSIIIISSDKSHYIWRPLPIALSYVHRWQHLRSHAPARASLHPYCRHFRPTEVSKWPLPGGWLSGRGSWRNMPVCLRTADACVPDLQTYQCQKEVHSHLKDQIRKQYIGYIEAYCLYVVRKQRL